MSKFLYVTKYKLLGADYAVHMALPLVYVSMKNPAFDKSKFDLANVTVTPMLLAWRINNLHLAFGIDLELPTGNHEKNTQLNVAQGNMGTELAVAYTYLFDKTGLEVSGNIMYDIQSNNFDDDAKNASYFHFDNLIGVHFDKWKLGVNSYYYKETTENALNVKGQLFGIGPAVGYEYGHINFALKYQKEMLVENRPQGDSFWLKVAIPF